MFGKYKEKRKNNMVVNQIYNLINSVSKQVWGNEAPSVQDLTGIIALGRRINVDGTWTVDSDKYLNALTDRIGKTVIRTLDTRIDFPKFLMNDFEFGAILQKINVKPLVAREDNSWNIGEDDFTSVYLDVHKPEITSSIFDTITTWTVKVTIPDTLFRTAFTSESAMMNFINGIMSAMTDSIESQINKMSHIAICNLIAEKKKANKNVINLVTLYNTATGGELTATAAMSDPDFLRFAAYNINNYIKLLDIESTKYNNDSMVRRTARDNMHVLILSQFASATNAYLRSDVYHDELVALPLYDEVGYWQNTGTTDTPDISVLGKVNIIPSSGGDAQVINNVIGVLADRQAIGTTIYERWSAADRFNSERRTNYTQGANIGWFNDLSENAIILTLN